MRGEASFQKQTKIYIGNIPTQATKEEVQGLFEKYGPVEECDIVKNYAFVHMQTEEGTKTAIEGLNKSQFMGAEISVEASHSKVRQRPGMGNRGQCFRCGRSGHWSKECPRAFGGPGGRGGRMGGGGGGGYGDGGGYGGDGGYGGGGYNYGGGSMPGFRDRMMGRYGMDRSRPYPDPYDRQAQSMGGPAPPMRDDYYDRYGGGMGAPRMQGGSAPPPLYSRRSPPPSAPAGSRFAYDSYDAIPPPRW